MKTDGVIAYGDAILIYRRDVGGKLTAVKCGGASIEITPAVRAAIEADIAHQATKRWAE